MDLTFILTEQCNLRCRYCYQKDFHDTRMPVDVAVKAIRAAIRQGADSLALTFFGGEPLLEAPALFEIMAEARRLEAEQRVPITAKVPTNGLLLDDSILRQAAEQRVFISLSFDGVEPAQNAGRLTPFGEGSFAAVERALKRLLAWGHPFAVYSVVTPANVKHLAASRQYLWESGVRIIINALDYAADWDERAVRELQSQYQLVGKLYRKLLKRKESFYLEPFDSRIAQWTRAGESRHCTPGVSQLTIAPDGTLYGCVEYFYRRLSSLGHVDSWLNRESVKAAARDRSAVPEECRDCGVRERCNNMCACINLRGTGRVNMPPESLCLTEQQTLFTVDDLAQRLFKERVPGFLLKNYSQSFHMLSGIEKLFEEMGVTHELAKTSTSQLLP
ncbi:MAG: radical SAM protein [Ardenticatenia bacterium]|nr:radical SAM protein [Ardenticatenia bacterium]